MLNYQYSTAGQNVQGKGAKEPGANKPESEQARGRISQEQGRKSQRANKPEGEQAGGQISQGVNKPGGEQARRLGVIFCLRWMEK